MNYLFKTANNSLKALGYSFSIEGDFVTFGNWSVLFVSRTLTNSNKIRWIC